MYSLPSKIPQPVNETQSLRGRAGEQLKGAVQGRPRESLRSCAERSTASKHHRGEWQEKVRGRQRATGFTEGSGLPLEDIRQAHATTETDLY